VLVPLIVRANGSADTYEIVAGKRRYHAARSNALFAEALLQIWRYLDRAGRP